MEETPIAHLLLKALLDEDRLLILGCLAQGDVSLSDLAGLTNLKEGALLRHMQLLQEVGLVQMAGSLYQLDITAVQQHKRQLFAPATRPSPDDVVARFVRDGRLLAIPLDKNWEQVKLVMGWLGEAFEHGRVYTEKELKEMLAHHAIDHATLRRYLVDTGVLERDNKGLYWRGGKHDT